LRLADEIFPIASAVGCHAQPIGPDAWEVELQWAAIQFSARERFSGAELRAVYGRWSAWAQAQVFAIADRLPV
jgi:hypothetical protein